MSTIYLESKTSVHYHNSNLIQYEAQMPKPSIHSKKAAASRALVPRKQPSPPPSLSNAEKIARALNESSEDDVAVEPVEDNPFETDLPTAAAALEGFDPSLNPREVYTVHSDGEEEDLGSRPERREDFEQFLLEDPRGIAVEVMGAAGALEVAMIVNGSLLLPPPASSANQLEVQKTAINAQPSTAGEGAEANKKEALFQSNSSQASERSVSTLPPLPTLSGGGVGASSSSRASEREQAEIKRAEAESPIKPAASLARLWRGVRYAEGRAPRIPNVRGVATDDNPYGAGPAEKIHPHVVHPGVDKHMKWMVEEKKEGRLTVFKTTLNTDECRLLKMDFTEAFDNWGETFSISDAEMWKALEASRYAGFNPTYSRVDVNAAVKLLIPTWISKDFCELLTTFSVKAREHGGGGADPCIFDLVEASSRLNEDLNGKVVSNYEAKAPLPPTQPNPKALPLNTPPTVPPIPIHPDLDRVSAAVPMQRCCDHLQCALKLMPNVCYFRNDRDFRNAVGGQGNPLNPNEHGASSVASKFNPFNPNAPTFNQATAPVAPETSKAPPRPQVPSLELKTSTTTTPRSGTKTPPLVDDGTWHVLPKPQHSMPPPSPSPQRQSRKGMRGRSSQLWLQTSVKETPQTLHLTQHLLQPKPLLQATCC